MSIEQRALEALERLRVAAAQLGKNSSQRGMLIAAASMVDGVVHAAGTWSEQDLEAVLVVCRCAEIIAKVDAFLTRAHERFQEAIDNARHILTP